jgi:hypothetical protein
VVIVIAFRFGNCASGAAISIAHIWTTNETSKDYQTGRPFLLEPFMNNQVAWI